MAHGRAARWSGTAGSRDRSPTGTAVFGPRVAVTPGGERSLPGTPGAPPGCRDTDDPRLPPAGVVLCPGHDAPFLPRLRLE